MNVLFLFASLPSLNDEQDMYVSLIQEFKNNGHQVLVSAKSRDNNKSSVREENGIRVLRIKSHPFTGVSNPIKKALAYQEYVVKQRYYTLKYYANEKIDLIISHSLPPELSYVVTGLKKHFNSPLFLIQSDYTWQDAVSLDYFTERNPVCLYYKYWEKKLINMADYIACPTKGNIDFILKYYPNASRDKFCVMPFWQRAVDVPANDSAINDPQLKGKFVVVYGGSLGKAQRTERIVDLAYSCRYYTEIVFLILGRGAYLSNIQQMAKDKGLCNVVFKEFLPKKDYLRLLSSCNVGLIVLHEMTGTPNFPSKSLSYFNMKVPVLSEF